jgi:transposase
MIFFIVPLFLISFFSTTFSSTRRDFEGMRDRRKQACKLFRSGKIQADIARELGVSRQSVSRWYSAWCEGGAGALNGKGRAGRLASIDAKELKDVERAILKGPLSHGYKTDMWTLQRVAEVIEKQTGVLYHPGHVWKILRQLGFSRQRPARRAIERDDEKILTWVKEDWPRVKKTQNAGKRGSVSKTSQGSVSSPL